MSTTIYGAINSVEDRPTNYQMARVDALDRELKDVEAQWAAFQSGDLATFNAKLRAANLPPLTIAEVDSTPTISRAADGSRRWSAGLVGTRFYGERRARFAGDGREGLGAIRCGCCRRAPIGFTCTVLMLTNSRIP